MDAKQHKAEQCPSLFVEAIYLLLVPMLLGLIPWAAWYVWDWWAGLIGIVAGQVLYTLFFKPSGLCMGIPWVYFATSCVIYVATVCAYGVIALVT